MNLYKFLTSRKYRLFTRKLRDVQTALWDLEFKVAKSRQVREGVRQDRDRAVSHAKQLEPQVENLKDKDAKEKASKELAATQDTIKRYEAQMQMIDRQVEGFQGSETEQPVVGVNEQMASLAELREMYKEYRSKI